MSMQMPPTRTLPHPWGEGREGVMNAQPLEQPVCQRSTGMYLLAAVCRSCRTDFQSVWLQ
jgi:hypothetical protein